MEPENQEKEIEMEQEPIKVYKGGAVNSVNGKTGDVVLTTSDLENDSDYQTGSEVDSSIDSAIGELNIPTKTSDLENDGEDGESVYIEADELAPVATSGSYNDLDNKPTIPAAQVNSDWNADSGVAQILNKPTIPTVNDATLTITQNGTSKGTFTANDADDTTIEVSDTTYSIFTGTDGVSAGTSGLVPAPATTDAGKFLKADGTWDTAGGGSVTTLTSADFNYPINNPDGIAMWLLPDGDYVTTLTSEYIYPDNGASKQLFRYFSKVTNGNSAIIYYTDSDNVWKYWTTNKNTGARISFGRMAPRVQQSSGTSQTDVMSQDATTKLVDGRVKQNAGAPTTSTVGTVGQLYEDTTNGKLYQCTAVSGGTYTWEEVGAGGGGSITPVQTTGTSTTDVMSQDATTKMIYPMITTFPDTINIRGTSGTDTSTGELAIAIGGGSSARGERAVSVGYNASSYANGDRSVAIGNFAKVNNNSKGIAIGNLATCSNACSVALGSSATTSRVGEVNIGAGTSGEGYNSTNYRVIGGVHDPVDAHDAATKGYVDAHSGGGGGGAIKLTTADYNYDTNGGTDYNAIALWLLDDDLYQMPDSSVNVVGATSGPYYDSFNAAVTNRNFSYFYKSANKFWFLADPSSTNAYIFTGAPLYYCTIRTTDGRFYVSKEYQLVRQDQLPTS